MLTKAAFWLLALAVMQVPSEHIVPKFFEDNMAIERPGPPSLGSRIVSGWPATLGQHPHHAHLRMTRVSGLVGDCGGSFVHREWVVSAAHCTATSINIVVRGGTISLFDTPEYISETDQFWDHPSYDSSNLLLVQPNDISILKLQQPISYSRNLLPIRIQESGDVSTDYTNKVLQASGHGRIWTNGPPSVELRWVYLRGISNFLCRFTFGSELVTDATICAQWFNVTSQSTCQGDSGGPLVYVNAKGQRSLVGVTSFNANPLFGGCHTGMPAAFIRPGYFHDWFTEVSGLDFENLQEETDRRQSFLT